MGCSPSPRAADHYLSVHAVNIYVRDQERSLRFFVDKLGFDVAFDARLQSGDRWVAVTPPDGSAVLTLVAPKRESMQHKLIGRATGIVLVTNDVTAKFEEWRKRGVRFLSTPRLKRIDYHRAAGTSDNAAPHERSPIWGGIFTRFTDVDGNSFSLVSFDEVTREVQAQRRAVEEKLEAERRAAQELDIARQVQARLFPQTLPPVASLEYAGICIQARQVGGDYYDFLNLGRERLGLVIGDIAGKGMAAALLMANLQANLRSLCGIALGQPEHLMRSVNQLFFENTTESAYATVSFTEYDAKTGCLRYVNCGHLPTLLLRRDNTLETLDSTATVVGLFDEWDCSIGEDHLYPGDTLALYTDGISETCNEAGEEFGQKRLVELLRTHRHLSAKAQVTSIVEEVQRFSSGEQHDDITLIVAKCLTPA